MSDNDTTQNRDTGHTPVTVIGLGLMGQALAAAFLRDGHPTTVWNRTAAKADQLVAQGAKLAGSAGDAVAASPLVVVCVTDYDAARELLDPLDLTGREVVNLTSGTSTQARETAAWVAKRGGTYLDGAIMAIPSAIGTEEGVVLYSGPRSAHEPVLRSLGAGVTRLGDDPGLASLYDVAVLSLMWGILNGFLHGAAILGTAGVDAAALASFVTQSIGTVAGWLPGYARQVDEGTYPADDATINTHLASMAHLVHESEALGVNAELPKLVKALADRVAAAGHGDAGYAAMIEVFRKP
jgi:3-hydroxyisobutyrate dehydrogenase-like beta-hydroxyacid dehydrogenase